MKKIFALIFLPSAILAMQPGSADSDHYTCMQMAVVQSDYEMLYHKLKDPNQVSVSGASFIGIAVDRMNSTMVAYLQSMGANINLLHRYRDYPEEAPVTVLDHALVRHKNNLKFITFLKNTGAKTAAELSREQSKGPQ